MTAIDSFPRVIKMLAFYYLLPLVGAYVKEGPLVNIVSEADYNQFLSDFYSQVRVILFHAPYETSSREVSPAFFAISKALQKENVPVKLAKVDITTAANKPILDKLENRPSGSAILYFLANSTLSVDYKSPFIQSTMKTAFTALVPRVSTFEEVEEFDEYFNVSSHRAFPLVLGKFAEFSGPQYELFLDFIRLNAHQFTFGLAQDFGQWSARFDLTEDAVIVVPTPVFSIFRDKPHYALTSFDSVEAVSTFVHSHVHMFFKWLTKETERYVEAPKRPLGILLGNFDPVKDTEYFRDYVTSLERKVRVFFSPDFQDRGMLFAVADRHEFKKELMHLGVAKDKLLFMIKLKDNRYILREHELRHDNGTLNVQAVADFCHAYKQGEVQPYVRTSPLPQTKYENGVRVAVGQTFADIVLDVEIDQLVLLYDPDSQLSVDAVRVVEEIAQKYEHPDQFEVVKIDGVNNALFGSYSRNVFPTLFYAKKNKKRRPEVYSGRVFNYADVLSFMQSPKEDL